LKVKRAVLPAASWPFEQKRLLEFGGQKDDLNHDRINEVTGRGKLLG
jgi:hypothetical protein